MNRNSTADERPKIARLCVALVVSLTVATSNPTIAQLAPPNDAGVTFSHVHLTVADTELHQRVWTELFGGSVVEREGYVAVSIPGALIFLRDREATAPSRHTPIDHFGVKVRDVESLLAGWRELGFESERDSVGPDGVSRSFITIPDGVTVALEEDPDLSEAAVMDHLHFFTPDPRGLKGWYEDLFGATAEAGSDTSSTAVPGATLRFTHDETDRIRTDSTAIDHIGFEVDDWDAFVEMVAEKEIQFDWGPVHIESLDLWVAFFPDPSGVLVEISDGLDGF